MRKFSVRQCVLGGLTACLMTAVSGVASAQVYYPMDIQVTNPEGKMETYTMYVPVDAVPGMAYQQQKVIVKDANGNDVYQTVYIPAPQQNVTKAANGGYQLSTNPWDDSATSSAPIQTVVAASPDTTAAVLGASATNDTAQIALAQQTALLSSGSSSSSSISVASSGTNSVSASAKAPTATVAASSSSGGTSLRDMELPTWVGTNTTYNTAMGQEAIAPEINKTNMISMVQHLRKLGYIVPDSLDTAIAEAPSRTKIKMLESIDWVQNKGTDPFTKAIAKASKDLEKNYGFSFENILGTSLDILDAR